MHRIHYIYKSLHDNEYIDVDKQTSSRFQFNDINSKQSQYFVQFSLSHLTLNVILIIIHFVYLSLEFGLFSFQLTPRTIEAFLEFIQVANIRQINPKLFFGHVCSFTTIDNLHLLLIICPPHILSRNTRLDINKLTWPILRFFSDEQSYFLFLQC